MEHIPDTWPTAMAGMAAARARIVDAGQWVSGPADLMAVLGIGRKEVINCRMVAWLLDPLARHGVGTRLLSSLAAELDLDIGDPTRVRVAVEVTKPNGSRADIVLYTPEGQVVIEAKIDAGEGDEQAAVLEHAWDGEALGFVFLTIDGGSPGSARHDGERWRTLRWAWIAERAQEFLEDAADVDELGARARESVSAWSWATARTLR